MSAPIVDAHVHLWDTRVFALDWLADTPELDRAQTLDMLRRQAGDRPLIAVQAGVERDEAEWLLETAHPQRADGVSAVVLQYAPGEGWAGKVTSAFGRPTADRIAGVRIPLVLESDATRGPEGADVLLAELERRGLVLEVLVRPEQLAYVDEVAAAHPELSIVVCHLGIGAGEPTADWRAAVGRLGGRANVAAKVSGLFRADREDAAACQAIAVALEHLGPERLMFGSDWPISSQVAHDYSEIVDRTALALGDLSERDAEVVWSTTASRHYLVGR